MAKATANRTRLLRVKESVWGVTPATPALIETRYTGESISNSITTEKSNEIRSDRMTSDLVLTDSSPSGAVNIELSYGSYDDFLIAGLMTTDWSANVAVVGVAGDISTVAGPTSNLTSGTAGKFTTILAGQYITLSGFTAPALNRTYRVAAKIDDQTLTLFPAPTVAETPALAAANVNSSGYIRNGVTESSFTVLKEFLDATVVTRHIFSGMRVGGFSFDMQTGSIMTGSINFMGKSAAFSESTFGGETIVPAASTEVMNSVTNLQDILQNGAVIGSEGAIMSLQVELLNNHREQKGIGVLGNVGVVAGTLEVNFTASQYFESKDQADMFESSEAFSFAFTMVDNTGNTYIFTAPRCKYETFDVSASGKDTDVMAETTFTALRDPVTVCMIQIDRIPAP